MESLLHYTWQNRLFGDQPLRTTSGEAVEVDCVGVHNHDAGPDFLEARVRIGGMLWAGNVELHTRASDWNRHGHDADEAYSNVILHVVAQADAEVRTSTGRCLPTLVIEVPERVRLNYAELLAEQTYPPCYRVIPHVPALTVSAWLGRMAAERLEEKTARIQESLRRTKGDWEWAYFALLARAFGFGVNSEAFEQWAFNVNPAHLAKHRDDAVQIEAYFFGMAGLLDEMRTQAAPDDVHFAALQREFAFLRAKFDLSPMSGSLWRLLRMRPQNFPHRRLAQLAALYCEGRTSLSQLVAAADRDALHRLYNPEVGYYWQAHFTFSPPNGEARPAARRLGKTALDGIVINAAAPMLFAYGRATEKEDLCHRALDLLAEVPAEQNCITRQWRQAGLSGLSAADSQALLCLKRNYCDRRRCLMCRFGTEYLRK